MKYRTEVDGLRALAVLPVVFFHTGIAPFSGGYVGVDVFFVISGYLITSILLAEMQSGKYSLIRFYERRARRILPALFLVCFATLPFAWIWLDPFALKEYSQSLVSVFSFSSNVYFYLKTGYFDVGSDLKPLLHTWSLAVEEQFYIIFPVLLFLIWRFAKKYLAATMIVIFLVSLVVSEALLARHFEASFYLLHSRAWELMAGSLAALYLFKKDFMKYSVWAEVFSIIGVALLLFAIFVFDDLTPFPGYHALLPVLGTVFIILFAVDGTFVNRALSVRAVVYIGLLSYSIYLWHQPVLAFFRIMAGSEPSGIMSAALILMVVLLSAFSYRYVETPFRKRRDGLFSRAGIFVLSAVGILSFAAVGVAGHLNNGFPERNAQFLRLQQNFGLSQQCSGAELDDPVCRTSDDPKVILWGDSHAMHLGLALEKIYSEAGLQQATLSACPPVPGYRDAQTKNLVSCYDYNEQVMQYLRQIDQPEERTVVISSSKNLNDIATREKFSASMMELKARGFQIIYVSTTPQFPDVGQCVVEAIRERKGFDACQYEVAQIKFLPYFENTRILSDELGIQFVDLMPFFCENGKCVVERDGVLFLRDGSHLAVEAMPAIGEYLKSRINVEP